MINRIYNDYFMKSRMFEYEELLSCFIKNDYIFLKIKDVDKKLDKNKKYIFIRHDIDSDIKVARKMFEIEKKLNVRSTYYFRLSTFDKKLVQDILEYGSEVGYHYEEIATYCKKNKIFDINNVKKEIKNIQFDFINNINYIESEYNFKLFSIASHGDFINRKINMSNEELFDDELKKNLNLIEAYSIEHMLDFRTSDCMPPKFFKLDPTMAIKQKKKRVLLLIHTRYWENNPIERIKLDFNRFIDNFKYH